MESESLRNIKTMRQVKSSLEVARKKTIRTTNNLFKTNPGPELIDPAADRQIGRILAREKARFKAYEGSVEGSRQRLLQSRKKLAIIINRNQTLTEMKHQLQQDRSQKPEIDLPSNPVPKKETFDHARLRPIDLKY
jgi:hypothetical protein